MTVRGRTDLAIAVVVGAALVVYAVSDHPRVDDVAYLGLIVGAALAACVGAARARPAHRLVGWLIAVGLSLSALGDVCWEILDALGVDNDVSVADPAWLACYVALSIALLVILRRSRASGDWAFVLDAATIVVVSLLLLGSSLVGTIVSDTDRSLLVRMTWSAYPVADAVLLALVVRVLTSRTARASLDTGFAVGVCLWLAADLAYLYEIAGVVSLAMDAAWMVAPVLIARSVWRLAEAPAADVVDTRRDRQLGQLVLAIGPLLAPPAIEVVADLTGRPDRPLLLVVGAATLTVIAFLRMALLVRSEERALAEARVSRDVALQASAAKSRFLGTVSHEVRTPLAVVVAASELLQDERLDDSQADLVEKLRRSGSVLMDLVDELLDFSRLDSGELQIESRCFDLVDVIEGAATKARARATAAGLTFCCTVEPGHGREAVGDPERLAQVVSILLDNALKFTVDGEVRLDVRRAPVDPDVLEVSVVDTGTGIAPEHLETVFDSFHQVDSSCLVPYSGIGLGLSICRELVTLMDGVLTVSSQPGVGSAFVASVRVPAGSRETVAAALSPA